MHGEEEAGSGAKRPGSWGERRSIREVDPEAAPDPPPVGVEQVLGWREGVRYVLWIQPPQGKDCTPVVDSLVSFVRKVLLKHITPCSAKIITGGRTRIMGSTAWVSQ